MRTGLAATAVVFSIIGIAAAEDVRASIRKPTLIGAQTLGSALQELAARRGLQVLYFSDNVRTLRTHGVSGDLTPAEAFDGLLSGTGLSYRFLDATTVGVYPMAAAAPAPSGPVTTSTTDSGADPTSSDSTEEPQKSKEDLVVVTGSRLLAEAGKGPVPVRSVTSEQIAASGQATVAQVLNTLPEVSTAYTESISESSSGYSTVQLHGLPAGTTLVLLNGRRLESGGLSFGKSFDLNSIPAAAIERIEILPVGSSAIYGSDALAGVVNIILKTDFRGAELAAHYGTASNVAEREVDAAWGTQWERASLSIVGSYLNRGGLQFGSRGISGDNDYRRFGGINSLTPFCNPGTVYSVDGSNLPGIGASSVAIPAGINGRPTIASLQPGAGQQNLCSYYRNYWAIPGSERYGGLVSFHWDITDHLQLFAEFDYSHVEQNLDAGPQTVYQSTLGANNPYNPFGVPVNFNYQFPASSGVTRSSDSTSRFMRPVVGLKGELVGDWTWEASAWQARDTDTMVYPRYATNVANFSATLNSSDPAMAFNPFSQTDPVSPQVAAGLYDPLHYRYESRANLANVYLRGPLARLPAGILQAVVGGEFDHSTLSYVDFGRTADYSRREASGFAEMRAPILSRPGTSRELLVLTSAVRYDHSNDYGGHTSPQFGFELSPTRTLLLRGSYAKSYRAPSLNALFQQDVTCAQCQVLVTDPLRGNAVTAAAYHSGGNRNLVAETGSSKSLGFDWNSQLVAGLRATVTYWDVVQKNRVTKLQMQTIVDDESLFPGFVTRGPSVNGEPGPIESIAYVFLNFGALEVAGLDGSVSYQADTAAGNFTPSLAMTYTTRYDAAVLPGAPEVSRLGRADLDGWAPRTKSTLALNWSRAAASAVVSVRYTSRYRDFDNRRDEGPYYYVDTSAAYDLGPLWKSNPIAVKKLEVRAGAVNLFNRMPDYSSGYGYGYDPTEADIRGRFWFINLDTRW